MDPTKNFDHLDPKLKETYARVMGTTPAGTTDPVQNTQPQPAPVDPTLSPPPTAFPTQTSQASYEPPFNAAPLDQTFTPPPAESPNPGTGPTINSMPTDSTTMFAPPVETAAPVMPAQDTNAPATSNFFSNPSPAATEPPQPAINNTLSEPVVPPNEPAPAPVTPYSPDTPAITPAPVASEQFSQPLPSPASVAQSAPKEASALLRVLYIIAAVVFFAIYTIFWAKVFGLPIPFLNF